MKLAVRFLAPLVAVGALASCSPSPKVAAVVDGHEITEAQVTTALESCKSFNLPLERTQIAFYLLISKVVDEVGERLDSPVERAQIDETLAADPTGAQLVGTACAEAIAGSIKPSFLVGDPVAIDAAVRDIDIHVNPRYGTWDPASGLDVRGGSISVPENPNA